MAEITLHGNSCHTSGNLPEAGSDAPDFNLTNKDLSDVSLTDFAGKKKILSIVPSVDTPTCATSTRKFNEHASGLDNVAVLVISADLPFAQARFCGAEGLENVHTLSTFRSDFADDYGIKITDGPLAGITGRAVVVIDENNKVIYSQLVNEIGDEPDYEAALKSI